MSERMAKVQILTFWLAERRFGLRLNQVMRVVRAVEPTPLPESPDPVLGVINFHGTILPLLSARGRFGFPGREIGLQDQFIVAETSRRAVAFLVDRATEVIEFSTEEIVAAETIVNTPGQTEGVVQIGDDLLLIYNLDRFLHPQEQLALDGALVSQAEHGN